MVLGGRRKHLSVKIAQQMRWSDRLVSCLVPRPVENIAVVPLSMRI